ncbi:MAG: M13 family metallopeptidase [Paludibacteraceae bacterium]|nr:M13 family metallopeptidase [Paludibacteraceae bacterium]
MDKSFVFLLSLMAITACNKPQTTGIHLENLDTTAVAQNDFYQYACGGWMKNNPLPNEYSRFGSFDKLGLSNLEQVNGLIADIAAKQHKAGSIPQKIGDVYNLSMDTARRNEEGIAPVLPVLQEIENVTDKAQWSEVLGKAMDYGLWAMYVDADAMNSSMNILNEYQAGFALSQKDYYVDEDEHTKHIRAEYLKHVEKMFELYDQANAAEKAATVLRLETRLAKAAFSNVELRDPIANYNKMSVEDLQKLVPEVDWQVYFNALFSMVQNGSELSERLNSLSIGQVRHLQEAGKMLQEESLEDMKTLFTWQVIDGSSDFLTEEIFMQNFEFYGKILSGRQEPTPLWKRAVAMVNGTLGEAVGLMYVEKYFPEENKERMLDLVKNLQVALGERIQALEWMSDETKAKAMEKLNTFTVKIGYPDKWRDYTALEIDPTLTYYANIQRAAKFEQDYSLSFLGKPVDKDKWFMTPQTVNAYYNPTTNEICFPAGILQYPFFDMNADDAFNYGAIGVVIGHEMTHGFDDQGSQFDKDGNLINWWTEEDRARFEERTKVMEEYFNAIEVAPGVNANGKFTLGENIADHGGLQVAYQAFQNAQKAKQAKGDEALGEKEGFTPEQRFFLAYANVWAGNIRPEEVLQRTKSDPHSLGMWRVNGALPHIGAWYDAFGVTPESPMYIAPEKRVSIW